MIFVSLLIGAYSLLILRTITPDLFMAQFIWIVLGFITFFIVKHIDPKVYKGMWPLIYVVSILLLAWSLLGPEIRGTHRWIQVFNQRLQPSELVKPFMIVSFAGYMTGVSKHRFIEFVTLMILFIIPCFAVFKQPDLGNSIVYAITLLFMLILSRFSPFYYIIPSLILFLSVPFAWQHLASYQKLRIETFINPNFDIQGAGYNARQALIAVGSGGIWGKGLGQGTQSKLQFLPEFHTDFIFAATTEQLGFVGGMLLIVLYFLLLASLLRKAQVASDSFQKLVSYGLFAQLFVQILINIGMNLGILPITGITLPLFSFGGSSIIATFITLGIIASLTKRKEHPVAIR